MFGRAGTELGLIHQVEAGWTTLHTVDVVFEYRNLKYNKIIIKLAVIKRLGKCVRSVVKVFFYCTDYVEIFRESGLWAAFSQCHKPVEHNNKF